MVEPLNRMTSRRPWVIGGAVLCFLAGCSSPEAYRRPSADLPAQWGVQPPVVANASAIAWESIYADPRLKALIRTALEKNHDVRLALELPPGPNSRHDLQLVGVVCGTIRGSSQGSRSFRSMRARVEQDPPFPLPQRMPVQAVQV